MENTSENIVKNLYVQYGLRVTETKTSLVGAGSDTWFVHFFQKLLRWFEKNVDILTTKIARERFFV